MKILFTLILWEFWIPFDKTGYKLNAESFRTSINIVICSKIILKFDEVPTTDNLPYVLNPLILLKLIQNIERCMEINIDNGNSKLH
jgi:hypothetical protein